MEGAMNEQANILFETISKLVPLPVVVALPNTDNDF